jgi:micrococcal nuclease
VRRVLLLSICLLASGCTRTAAPPDDPGAATVTHVVDGDTVVVDLSGRQETLRLIGVDTPEVVDPDQPPECFGAEASAHTKDLLPEGTEVRLTRDVESRDRYDRLLVYVERAEDGLFVNLDLVAGGWADDYPFPPNTAHQRDFALAVAQARAEGLGLWSTCGDADTPAG